MNLTITVPYLMLDIWAQKRVPASKATLCAKKVCVALPTGVLSLFWDGDFVCKEGMLCLANRGFVFCCGMTGDFGRNYAGIMLCRVLSPWSHGHSGATQTTTMLITTDLSGSSTVASGLPKIGSAQAKDLFAVESRLSATPDGNAASTLTSEKTNGSLLKSWLKLCVCKLSINIKDCTCLFCTIWKFSMSTRNFHST